MKSVEMSPPRKYPIPNQYINRLRTEKDQSLPPHLAKYYPGYKSLINEAEDDCNYYIDTTHTDKEDYVKNQNNNNNKDNDAKYKDDNSQDRNINYSFINKNE